MGPRQVLIAALGLALLWVGVGGCVRAGFEAGGRSPAARDGSIERRPEHDGGAAVDAPTEAVDGAMVRDAAFADALLGTDGAVQPLVAVCSEDRWCWSAQLPQGNGLQSVHGSSSGGLYVVGNAGTILRFDGSGWAPMDSGTSAALSDVWSTGPNDAFAVGRGVIVRLDDTGWSEMVSGSSQPLLGVWASSPDDVFAVGAVGEIVHFDGTAWSPMVSGIRSLLYGVWGSGPDDVLG